MATCCSCKKELPDESFAWKIKERGIRQARCRSCHAEYRQTHYRKNRRMYIAKAQKWNLQQRKIIIAFLRDYLLRHSCVDCGDSRLEVLDFDHVRGKKRMPISKMLRYRYSIDTIKDEIAKCEVRCASCHRVQTSARNGWWKTGQ